MDTTSFYGKKRTKIRITDVSGIVESTNTEHHEEIPDGTSDVDDSGDEIGYFLVSKFDMENFIKLISAISIP